MSDDDRTERVQRALDVFARMMRPPFPDPDDPDGPAELEDRMRALAVELAALDLTREEFEEAQLLYFEGRSAFAPFVDERVAKLAYLVKHAPGAPSIGSAIERLTDKQLEEFERLSGEDL